MSSTSVVHDQSFPDRPVRIIDPFGAGGGVDVIARALARRLAAAWGQPAIVENHPGAGSTAAPALVAHAPPDGYTLLINTSAQAYSAARAGELPYDPLRDFVPVAALTSQPYVLVTGGRSGITTIDELAAAASDRPGEIRFGSAGIGTGTHLAVAKLNRDLGIAAVHTPPAATDAITDVIAGTAAGHTTYAMLPIPHRRSLHSRRQARRARGQHSAPLAPAAERTAAHRGWRRRLRFPDLVRDLGASANTGQHRQHARPRHHGHPRHARTVGMADAA